MSGVHVLLIKITPVRASCAELLPAVYVLAAPAWKFVSVACLVQPVSVLFAESVPV